MNKETDYFLKEMTSALTLKESYGFENVEKIKVLITASWNDRMNGKSIEYNTCSKACFIIRCPFSECYGPLTGFRFENEIRGMVRQQLTTSTFHVECGGFGDLSNQYHCDNWVDIKVTINYYDD